MVKWPFSSSKDVHIKEFVPPLISKWFPLLDPLAEIKDDSEITYAHVLIAEMVYEYDLMFESKVSFLITQLFQRLRSNNRFKTPPTLNRVC